MSKQRRKKTWLKKANKTVSTEDAEMKENKNTDIAESKEENIKITEIISADESEKSE